MTIHLHIDQLILHGFAPGDRHRIGAAVERELSRMFAERSVPASLAQGGNVTNLDGGTFQMSGSSNPETIGTQVAQAVYGGLNR